MSEDESKSPELERGLEAQVARHLVEMTLALLKGSFATRQSWRQAFDAANHFSSAKIDLEKYFAGQDIRPCFQAAIDELSVDIPQDDPWMEAAAAGARYHLQNVSTHGHAFGHRERTRSEFIELVKRAMASGQK